MQMIGKVVAVGHLEGNIYRKPNSSIGSTAELVIIETPCYSVEVDLGEDL